MKVIRGVVKAVILILCVALVASAVYLAYIFVTSGFNTSAVEHEVEVIMVRAESLFTEQADSLENRIESSAESVTRVFENAGDKAEEAIESFGGKVEDLVESVGNKVGED